MFGVSSAYSENVDLQSGFYDYSSSGFIGGTATINLPGGGGTVVISGGSGAPQPVLTTGNTTYTTPVTEQGFVSLGMLALLIGLAYIFLKK